MSTAAQFAADAYLSTIDDKDPIKSFHLKLKSKRSINMTASKRNWNLLDALHNRLKYKY